MDEKFVTGWGGKVEPERPAWKVKAWKDLNRRFRDMGIDELTWEQFEASAVSNKKKIR